MSLRSALSRAALAAGEPCTQLQGIQAADMCAASALFAAPSLARRRRAAAQLRMAPRHGILNMGWDGKS